jgi:hypothetical protein
VPGITAAEAARLKKEKRVQRLGTTIELVTERTGGPGAVAGNPVLAVWVDDDQLERIARGHEKVPTCGHEEVPTSRLTS